MALEQDLHPYLALEHPIRMAHRGSRVLWPENTALAFQGAVDLGYRYIETDVRLTRDGVVVVFHDARLERLTNGSGRVRDWGYDELRRLDAAYHFAPDRGHPLRGRGVSLMTLEEALATWPEVHFNVDLKDRRMEWRVAEVVKRLRRDDTTLVGGFSDLRTARYRRIMGPGAATSGGPGAVAALVAASRLGRSIRTQHVAYQLPRDSRAVPLDGRLVRTAHEAGAQVHVWTVDDKVEMDALLDLGVDGIITDRPDLLNEVVAGRTPPAGE